MFSPLEAAAYRGQLPEQRGQNAVNPQLKNLFAIQAAMDAKKHADEQLAAALGQQTQSQPTVAQGLQQAAQQALKPEAQSPRDVATQNMGLPGLMQGGQQPPQGQPPQGQPPQGQPPQAGMGQPPQQMASGGLADARSNLPSSYAGGGIVSFDAGGVTDLSDATQKRLQTDINVDPEALSAASAAARAAALGPAQQDRLAAQQGGIDKLAALQAAKASERPSQFWETINAIGAKGPNVMPGQWGAGVAGTVQKARAGYADEDIANQTKLNSLTDAMNKAKEENDIGAYNAAREVLIKAQTDRGLARADAVRLVDAHYQWSTRKEMNDITNQTRLDTAEDRNKTLQQQIANRRQDLRIHAEDKVTAADAKRMETAERDGRAAGNKAASDFIKDPTAAMFRQGDTEDSVYQRFYKRYMSTVRGYVPIEPDTISPSGNTRQKFDSQGNLIK